MQPRMHIIFICVICIYVIMEQDMHEFVCVCRSSFEWGVWACVCDCMWEINAFTFDIAVCCSVLPCVAACCSVLPCVAVCCCVLPCAAACCSVLPCVCDCTWEMNASTFDIAVCCSVLQCVAACCSVLQCVAIQCVALCCSVL